MTYLKETCPSQGQHQNKINERENIAEELFNNRDQQIQLKNQEIHEKYKMKELLHTISAKFLFECAGEYFCGFISYNFTLIPLLAN